VNETELDSAERDATLLRSERRHDEDDRLKPEFVRAVIDRVEAATRKARAR
jgi:hypothetical protein